MSNLSRYEMEETAVLHLRDASDELMYADGPNGEPDLTKPMRAHLFGPGSRKYAAALNARQNHAVNLIRRKGQVKEGVDEAIRTNAQFLADCTDFLENMDTDSGATGAALSLEIYSTQKLSFIRDQIAVYLNETANFTKGSAKS